MLWAAFIIGKKKGIETGWKYGDKAEEIGSEGNGRGKRQSELLQLRLWQLLGQDLPYTPKLPLKTAAAASTAFPSSSAVKRMLSCSRVAFPSSHPIDSFHSSCPLCSYPWPTLSLLLAAAQCLTLQHQILRPPEGAS